MFRVLRNHDGGPNARVRVAALLLVLGLVLATAPLIVGPVVEAGWQAVFHVLPGF